MTTRILRTDHLISVPPPTNVFANNDGGRDIELHPEGGNIFLGFFFGLLLNVILVIVGAATLELWRLIR